MSDPTVANIASQLSPVSAQNLLHLHSNAGVWRVPPGAVRKKLRTSGLVMQNRHDDWELTELGHQVRKHLTGEGTAE